MTQVMTNNVWKNGSNLTLEIIPEDFIDFDGLFNYKKLEELLGEHDTIFCSELNTTNDPSWDYLMNGKDSIYFLTPEDIDNLKENGIASLIYQGSFNNDFFDPEEASHVSFFKWING